MTEPLTPRDLEFMRLQAAHAALLQVVLQLAYTVATLSPDTRARLLQQCEMLLRATEGWSLQGSPTPELSMLLAEMQAEQMATLVEGLRKTLGA